MANVGRRRTSTLRRLLAAGALVAGCIVGIGAPSAEAPPPAGFVEFIACSERRD